jgi:peptide/nickel transport system permease protein
VSLALGGLDIWFLHFSSGSLWIPTFIIGVVGVVYLARPIRGQVLALREKEFVEAARAQGAGNLRIMFGELLPNIASTLLVFFPIVMANAILLEAALSFLGAGVQPPSPSWGTMIADGLDSLISAPHQTLAPGIMLVLTVLSINVFGEGVRDALDPRAKIKLDA